MKFYTISELSEILSLHPDTIRILFRSGKLKGYKVGREWRATEETLKEYLESKSNYRKEVDLI